MPRALRELYALCASAPLDRLVEAVTVLRRPTADDGNPLGAEALHAMSLGVMQGAMAHFTEKALGGASKGRQKKTGRRKTPPRTKTPATFRGKPIYAARKW